jgi:iron complex outermembrane receptor protein
MIGLKILRSALVGGASVMTLAHPAAAKLFDIPGGDLAVALGSYMQQAGVEIVYSENFVRGHHSRGARGDYSETAALTQILRGTGFTAQTVSPSAIGIVPQQTKPAERLAQATRPAPAALAPVTPAAPTAIETVVVTAQHKSENIQQVPIAVTALSQEQLTARQIAAGPDLIRDVPNMNFGKTNFSGYSIELRGIGTQAISVTTDPAVAVAYNGIPFLRNHFFEQEFFDMDNIEVLRGPQGTLYGRNATAGVVNLIPALPTDTFEGMMSADVGNYMERRLEGMINLPIVGDQLDIRVAGEWTKRSGYTDDTTLSTDVDGRDLWSGRVTIGFKPTSDLQTYLLWEHFSEDDDRLRSGKQLCETSNPPASVDGVAVPPKGFDTSFGGAFDPVNYLSQGCQAASLYSPQSFEVPYGNSLPYVAAAELVGVIATDVDPYAETTQSTNLRLIQSAILPHYRAKNDIVEFNADYKVAPGLTLTSQTGWNSDFLYSTEDYNRFDTSPGIFIPGSADTGNIYTNEINSAGVFCDPQLGCANRLVAEDLSDETAWQFSQEFRLASNFSGPFNFDLGANYLHYVTEENYYVFINALTLYSLGSFEFNNIPVQPYNPATSTNASCMYYYGYGYQPRPPTGGSVPSINQCIYIDHNPIGSVNNMGHNYFLSQNPYYLNSYAVFGETYYDILNDLKLTTGLRFTEDQKAFTDIPSELVTDGWGYYSTGNVDQKWDRFTGRTVLDWTPEVPFTDQTLIYGSYAHGYKAGGANPPGAALGGNAIGQVDFPDHPLTFKPEYIEAFELGTKNTLLGGSLTLNGDVFYYNYTGYQISEIVDRTAINNNYNAHVEGAELESNWEPLPGLKFNFAGGWEDTSAAGGDSGIDLIDRTAGNPNWMVVKPFPAQASNCILPTYVVAALLTQAQSNGNPLSQACGAAYNAGVDPITDLPYVANPTVPGQGELGGPWPIPAGYPGFNPATAPNNGEGFSKNLTGHALPNAPPFTVSLGSQYTVPVADNWAATLRGDFYWQADSWARIFNDNPYDRLDGYTNVNLALIFASDDGWQIMGYVKNVFNVTAITGDFLNSDDSGLTTNVFLTDPRLYGVRITKNFGEGDTGAMGNVENWIAGIFSDADKHKPTLWFTFGGDFPQLTGQGQPFVPSFLASNPNSPAFQPESPMRVQSPQSYTYDKEAQIIFQPVDSDWEFVAGVQIGRASRSRSATDEAQPHSPLKNSSIRAHYNSLCYCYTNIHVVTGVATAPPTRVDFSTTQSRQSEFHAIIDLEIGKDVGLGLLGPDDSSTFTAGLRMAQFVSKSSASIQARPDLVFANYPHTDEFDHVPLYLPFDYHTNFHTYGAQAQIKRSFQGIGPKIAWKDSVPLLGNTDATEFTFDWGANAALLFGRRKVAGEHRQTGHYFQGNHYPNRESNYYSHYAQIARSKEAMVPNLGGFAGMSVKFQNAKVSFGYKGDFFFNAMDGGWDQAQSKTVGLFGPFANLSIGF